MFGCSQLYSKRYYILLSDYRCKHKFRSGGSITKKSCYRNISIVSKTEIVVKEMKIYDFISLIFGDNYKNSKQQNL